MTRATDPGTPAQSASTPATADLASAGSNTPAPEVAHQTSDILTMPEVAAEMRSTVAGIYGKLWRGTMLPVPIAEHPYRWNREDIERWKRGEFRDAEATLRKKAKLRGSYRRRVG